MINVLTPSLAFSSSYINAKVHNMLVIMLDLCLKNMKMIWDYVGNMVVVNVVLEYDFKVVYPLLLQVYPHLNCMKATTNPTTLEDDDCFFG